MADYVTPKLPNRVIPITKGCDSKLTIRRRDPSTSDPVDWGADVYMLIDIDKFAPTKVLATVSNSLATVVVESSVTNQCKNGTTWRVVMSSAGSPSYERPLMVGTFERNDGK